MARKVNPEVRERILKEAEHLIHLCGYRCTSLEDIAQRCGMTKANLFHHFKSKEDLGLAVLDYKMRCYRCDCLQNQFADDPVEGVGRLFSDCAKHYRGNGCKAGCFFANIALEMADTSEAFRKKVDEFFGEWIRALESALRKARSAGDFPPSFSPGAAAEAVFALYEGAILLARTRRDPEVFTRMGKQARQLLEAHRLRRSHKRPVEV